MNLHHSLLVGVLVALSFVPTTLAQEADDDPLMVVPVGREESTWERTYWAIRSVPSPIGVSPPGLIERGFTTRRAVAVMQLGVDRALYAYDCGETRCVGPAGEVWLALVAEQRQEYLNQVLDALIQEFPDRPTYFLRIDAGLLRHPAWTAVQQREDGSRLYTER